MDSPRGPRNLQFFMKDSKWNDEEASKIYQEGQSERLSDDEGMITIDESGFVKKVRILSAWHANIVVALEKSKTVR